MLRNKIVLGLVVTFAIAHPSCTKRPKKRYTTARKVSKVVSALSRFTKKFDSVLHEEIKKTKVAGVAFRKYNPKLLRRLRDALKPIDVTNPKVQRFVEKNVWTIKFRRWQDRDRLQPRLYLYFSYLGEVVSAVRTAVAIEARLRPVLRETTTGASTMPDKLRRTAAHQVALNAYAETIRAISRALKKIEALLPAKLAKQLRRTQIEGWPRRRVGCR